MRKLVYQMMQTLNGRIDDPFAWIADLSDDAYIEIDRVYSTFDTVLVGRVTYEEMAAYWPGAETEEGGSETNRRMARKMNSYRKLVFSRGSGPQFLEWNNAELVRAETDEDLVTFIEGLKATPGGDIHLAGGGRLAQSIIRLGLVDEYHFFIHPVVSIGATWFDQIEDTRRMKLTGVAAYENGVVGLYYTSADTPDMPRPERFSSLLA